jgi:hypothetical protein
VLALFGSLEMLSQKFELLLADLHFAQVKSDSELGVGDVAGSELVKVAEELRDADPSLEADLPYSGAHVLHIGRRIADDLSLTHTRLGLREIVKRVVVILAYSKQVNGAVNLFTEVNIVNFIDVAFIHVASQHSLGYLLRRRNF